MKTFHAFAGTGLLLIGSAAFAQDVMGPAEPMADPMAPSSETAAPMEPAAEPAPAAEAAGTPPAPGQDAASHADAVPVAGPAMGAETAQAAFTDAEIQSFATAALEIQSLQGDDAAKQEQAAAILAGAGIDPATFNAIGQAMQTDPAVAERVQLAAAGLQGQPEG